MSKKLKQDFEICEMCFSLFCMDIYLIPCFWLGIFSICGLIYLEYSMSLFVYTVQCFWLFRWSLKESGGLTFEET